MSLRIKWSLLAVFLAAAPLLFLAFRTLSTFRKGFHQSEQKLEAVVAEQVRVGVEVRMTRAADTSRRVGRLIGDAEVPREARLAWVGDLLATEPMVERIGLYGLDKKLIDEVRQGARDADASNGLGGLPAELPAMVDERSIWLPVLWKGETPELRLIVPVGKGGETNGWVLARLAPGALDDAVRAVTSQIIDNAEDTVVILSPEGRKIAGQGDPKQGQAFREAIGAASTKTLVSKGGVSLGGEPMTGAVLPLEQQVSGMSIIIVRPERVAFPELGQTQRELVIACVVLLVASLLLALWLASRTTRPIAALVALTKRYAAREFAARSDVRTGDELETLGDSMSGMADALAASEQEIARRAQVEAGLSRYMPEEIAKAVAEGKGKLELGGERKEVSVLFGDVVAFTTFSEKASPETVVQFLNELFGLLSEIVFRHGGIVDKFMGDSIMAVFGAQVGGADDAGRSSADRAVACAEDMHRFVDSVHAEWERKYQFQVRLGIGVARGPAVVGNLGSEKRMEYTAIGDAVNVAARLESMARPGQTLVTHEVVAAAPEFEFQSMGRHALRGKSEETELFELVAG
jgi:class 3 adenylate cyclase